MIQFQKIHKGKVMRILIIEDDAHLTKELSQALNAGGYQTDIAENLKDGGYYISIRNYDLVLSGWLFTDGMGLEVLEQVKERNPRTPVVMISNKPDGESEIQAFQSGADDFLSKPLNIQPLVARLKTRLKVWDTSVIQIEELNINPDEEKVVYKGREVDVKGKPFEVLIYLARHRDQVVSKEQLLDAIWEEPELVTPNVIEVAINQIRQKMDKPLGISTIETVRRRGYRFCYPKGPSEELA